MAITIWEEISWRKFTLRRFTQRRPWCALRSPAVRTLLAVALCRNLRPGDELLSPVGKPYDTLEEVIGIRPSNGSLAEYGVTYRQVDLKEDGSFDYPGH